MLGIGYRLPEHSAPEAVHCTRHLSIHGRMIGKVPPHLDRRRAEGLNEMPDVELISITFLSRLVMVLHEMSTTPAGSRATPHFCAREMRHFGETCDGSVCVAHQKRWFFTERDSLFIDQDN